MNRTTIHIQGRSVSAYSLGKPGAPPLVFFQGFGIHPKHYAPLLKPLADTHHIVSFDLLRPGVIDQQPTDIATFASLAKTLLDSLDLQQPPTFIGHSLGGAVSLQLAAHNLTPNALVLLGPALFPPKSLAAFIARSGLKGARESLGREGLQAARFASQFHPSFLARTLRHPRRTLRLLDDLKTFDPTQHSLTCPVHIAFFERDEYFTLTPHQRTLLHETFPTLHIETIPSQNHDGLVFQPSASLQFIREAL